MIFSCLCIIPTAFAITNAKMRFAVKTCWKKRPAKGVKGHIRWSVRQFTDVYLNIYIFPKPNNINSRTWNRNKYCKIQHSPICYPFKRRHLFQLFSHAKSYYYASRTYSSLICFQLRAPLFTSGTAFLSIPQSARTFHPIPFPPSAALCSAASLKKGRVHPPTERQELLLSGNLQPFNF